MERIDKTLLKTMREVIYTRKSVRSYKGEPVDETTIEQIETFIQNIKPLYADIKVKAEIVPKDAVKCIFPWTTSQNVAIYTEDKFGAMENVGFMFQQLDLYLQSIGLGSCWLGVAHLDEKKTGVQQREDTLQYVLTLTFGYPKEQEWREDASDFRRKMLSEISTPSDERLEPARLAPSSMNSQPWYFVGEDAVLRVYAVQRGVPKAKQLNRIDVGIALAHLYVSNPDTFQFFQEEDVPERKGYQYIGSVVV